MNGIGWAVKELQQGNRVYRSGWNGRGMWLILVYPGIVASKSIHIAGEEYPRLPYIGMKTVDGSFVPWLASQTDILAVDWEIA
jgi:uncharacterized protein DUF2829